MAHPVVLIDVGRAYELEPRIGDYKDVFDLFQSSWAGRFVVLLAVHDRLNELGNNGEDVEDCLRKVDNFVQREIVIN